MSESGPNQRIEPPPRAEALHLHERSGSGVSRKDPTKAVIPDSPAKNPPPSLFPPSLELPDIPEIPASVGTLRYNAATFEIETTSDGGTTWTPISALALTSWLSLVESEVLITGLPTADPGGGLVWLSSE